MHTTLVFQPAHLLALQLPLGGQTLLVRLTLGAWFLSVTLPCELQLTFQQQASNGSGSDLAVVHNCCRL